MFKDQQPEAPPVVLCRKCGLSPAFPFSGGWCKECSLSHDPRYDPDDSDASLGLTDRQRFPRFED